MLQATCPRLRKGFCPDRSRAQNGSFQAISIFGILTSPSSTICHDFCIGYCSTPFRCHARSSSTVCRLNPDCQASSLYDLMTTGYDAFNLYCSLRDNWVTNGRMARFHALYDSLRGIILIIPFSLHLIVADLLLSSLLPLSPFVPSFVYGLSSSIAGSVWCHIQAIFTRFNRASLTFGHSSAQLPYGESAIVIANHASWTDFYMIQALAQRAGMLQRCRWFAKSQLRWVPLLGWGLWAMGMPLVTRDWTHDRGEMERVFGGIKNRRWPICMTLKWSLDTIA